MLYSNNAVKSNKTVEGNKTVKSEKRLAFFQTRDLCIYENPAETIAPWINVPKNA